MRGITPVDPARMVRNGQLLMEGGDRLGPSHHPLRRNAGTCYRCNTCPMGCRLDAKRAMHVSYLPRAVAAGARIRAGVEARRVMTANGRAYGVACQTSDGRDYEVRARAVVASAGAIGTPELLLRSGLRDPGDQLGRNLRVHPAAWVGAGFADEVRGWEGVMQSYCVDEWKASHGVVLEATFTPLAFGAQWLPGVGTEHQERLLAYDRLASTGVHISDRSSGRVGLDRSGGARVTYWLTRDDAAHLHFGIARAAEIFFAAGAREVYSQIRGRPVIDRNRVADFEASRPSRASMRLEAFHPMGSARMSGNPALGPVDTTGALRDVEGVYVADTSLFPTSLGVNPMVTAIAMSAAVGRRLAEKLA
jgi:choline dehydrogenase-like flavoprotein